MKKLLLSFAAACVVTAASAAVADLTKVWEKPVENAYEADAKAWNAPVAVDAAGNVIATGAFTEDLTIAGATLEAVGTSAYVVKYDKTGAAAWAVAFTGAATITAIDTDADGNIYIAGTLADEVTFGTTSGDPVVKEGLKIDDAPTTDECASFIAKYDSKGKVVVVETFLPEPFADLAATGAYFPAEEDLYFHINHIKINGDNVYASAIFTNEFKKGSANLTASCNDAWGIGFYSQLPAVCVISLDKNLANCASIVSCFVPERLMLSEEEYKAQSINFDVTNSSIFAVMSGSGALKIEAANGSRTLEANFDQYNYIFVEIENGSIAQLSTSVCPDAGISAKYTPSFAKVSADKFIVAGNEAFAENYNTADERISNEIFVFTAATDNLTGITKKVHEETEGDITYYNVTSAAILPGGEIYINTLGCYNNTKTEKVMEGDKEVTKTIFSKGDFANTAKSFVFANDAFAPATTVADAVGVAAAGSYVAFSQIGETGAVFSLYNDSKSGIADIVADENAEAEYFNLQGVRVANPENGLYIVRRGTTVTKEIIRK